MLAIDVAINTQDYFFSKPTTMKTLDKKFKLKKNTTKMELSAER